MNRSVFAAPLLAVLAALPMQAQAGFTASSSMFNIRYTLTDLDLADGVTPYLSFDPADGQTVAFYTGYSDYDSGTSKYFSADPAYFDTRTVSFDTTTPAPYANHVQGSASISGDSLATFKIAGSGTVDGTTSGGAYSNISLRRPFTLSPHTLVSISVDVDLAASSSNPSVQGYGTSDAYIIINDYDMFHATYTVQTGTPDYGTAGGQTLTATYSSYDWETRVNADFWVTTSVHENGTPLPVPEPETYAMLLAGLGLLGWRRHARQG